MQPAEGSEAVVAHTSNLWSAAGPSQWRLMNPASFVAYHANSCGDERQSAGDPGLCNAGFPGPLGWERMQVAAPKAQAGASGRPSRPLVATSPPISVLPEPWPFPPRLYNEPGAPELRGHPWDRLWERGPPRGKTLAVTPLLSLPSDPCPPRGSRCPGHSALDTEQPPPQIAFPVAFSMLKEEYFTRYSK